MAYVAHFGGECIDAGCVDGLRIPVKMWVNLHRSVRDLVHFELNIRADRPKDTSEDIEIYKCHWNEKQ